MRWYLPNLSRLQLRRVPLIHLVRLLYVRLLPCRVSIRKSGVQYEIAIFWVWLDHPLSSESWYNAHRRGRVFWHVMFLAPCATSCCSWTPFSIPGCRQVPRRCRAACGWWCLFRCRSLPHSLSIVGFIALRCIHLAISRGVAWGQSSLICLGQDVKSHLGW